MKKIMFACVFSALTVVSLMAATVVNNKICPVSAHKIGDMGEVITYNYNDKTYNLCCKACLKDFKANPAKYSSIADAEVAQ